MTKGRDNKVEIYRKNNQENFPLEEPKSVKFSLNSNETSINETHPFKEECHRLMWYFSGFFPLFIFVILHYLSSELKDDSILHLTLTPFIIINLIFFFISLIYGIYIYVHIFRYRADLTTNVIETTKVTQLKSGNRTYSVNLIELILPLVFIPVENVYGQIMYFVLLFLLLYFRLSTIMPYINLLVAFEYNTYTGITEKGKNILIVSKEPMHIPKGESKEVHRINHVPLLFVNKKQKSTINNLLRFLELVITVLILMTIFFAWLFYIVEEFSYTWWKDSINLLGGKWIWDGRRQIKKNSISKLFFSVGCILIGIVSLIITFFSANEVRKAKVIEYERKQKKKSEENEEEEESKIITYLHSAIFFFLGIGAFLAAFSRDHSSLRALHYIGAALLMISLGMYSIYAQYKRWDQKRKKKSSYILGLIWLFILFIVNGTYLGIAFRIAFYDSIHIVPDAIMILNAFFQKLCILLNIISIWGIRKKQSGLLDPALENRHHRGIFIGFLLSIFGIILVIILPAII